MSYYTIQTATKIAAFVLFRKQKIKKVLNLAAKKEFCSPKKRVFFDANYLKNLFIVGFLQEGILF